MLVICRKEQELIDIGDNISVRVVRINGGKVRLGISAPRDLVISRREDSAPDQSEKNSDSFEKTDS